MKRKNVWIAGLATPVMIVMLPVFPGSSRVTATDRLPAATAEVKIDSFSKVLDTDETFSYTFANAGTYPYCCTIHPKMTGKVFVQ
jgi:plastocyanin